jgi:hypothetical protein
MAATPGIRKANLGRNQHWGQGQGDKINQAFRVHPLHVAKINGFLKPVFVFG